jgi:hypothetical protein
MSAFMVNHAHIDALVSLALWGPRGQDVAPGRWFRPSWYAQPINARTSGDDLRALHREARIETADAVGQMLAEANARSVRYRYQDADECGMLDGWAEPHEPVIYRHALRPSGLRPTAIEGLKIIACFEYQACEHPDWRESEALAFCRALRYALIACLPGYDAAPWEWPGRPEG